MKFLNPIVLLIIAIISLIGLTACSSSSEEKVTQTATLESSYRTIAAEEAKTIMDSGEPYTLVDVRTQEEFDEKHIQGALLIPNETIGTEPIELLPDLNARILVYCRSGNRSRQAAEKLVSLGYTQIIDFGGIIDWPYGTESK